MDTKHEKTFTAGDRTKLVVFTLATTLAVICTAGVACALTGIVFFGTEVPTGFLITGMVVGVAARLYTVHALLTSSRRRA